MKKIFSSALFFILITTTYIFLKNELRILRVVSPSMEPAIKKGSLIMVKSNTKYSIGDIISYKSDLGSSILTHRIEKIVKIENHYFFITKGDNNEAEDPNPVSQKNIIGKVIFSISFIRIFYENRILTKTTFILFMFIEGFILGNLFKQVIKELEKS